LGEKAWANFLFSFYWALMLTARVGVAAWRVSDDRLDVLEALRQRLSICVKIPLFGRAPTASALVRSNG
jgi:hypothetical protein